MGLDRNAEFLAISFTSYLAINNNVGASVTDIVFSVYAW